MEKIILQDVSTCCAICFEMLDPDTVVYVDDDNDIICENCIKDME